MRNKDDTREDQRKSSEIQVKIGERCVEKMTTKRKDSGRMRMVWGRGMWSRNE